MILAMKIAKISSNSYLHTKANPTIMGCVVSPLQPFVASIDQEDLCDKSFIYFFKSIISCLINSGIKVDAIGERCSEC
jgi:hypothetical protein